MTKHDQNMQDLHDLAMRFYREAEAPTEQAFSALFWSLAYRKKDAVLRVLREAGVEA